LPSRAKAPHLPKFRIGSVYLTAMSEEDDPLARDGNWHCLSISFDDPRVMEQMGPNLEVSIAAVTEQGTTLAHHKVSALIDTGSKSSCISPRLAPKMEGGLRGVRLSHIYGLLEGPPTIRGLVRFKKGVELIRDFSVLDDLAPYDVLIGRDILREGRMYIDGGAGHFRLYFPDRTA
jgi:Retroviral aspartyl protease